MITKITEGEKTYWLGMTEPQVKSIRFLLAVVLTMKETEASLDTTIRRTDDGGGGHVLMWESAEALEHALKELIE